MKKVYSDKEIVEIMKKMNRKYSDYYNEDEEMKYGGFIGTLLTTVGLPVAAALASTVGKRVLERVLDKVKQRREMKQQQQGAGARKIGGKKGMNKFNKNKDMGCGCGGGVENKFNIKDIRRKAEYNPIIAGAGKKKQQPKKQPKKQQPKKSKNNRWEIVKKVMKNQGLSMIEASKYIKENNLY
jgi:hypothetical protein